jgi:hypothetical protein
MEDEVFWIFTNGIFSPISRAEWSQFEFKDNPDLKFGNVYLFSVEVHIRAQKQPYRFLVYNSFGKDENEAVLIPDFPNLIYYLHLISPIILATWTPWSTKEIST